MKLETLCYIPLSNTWLCECGLVGNCANRCACGNTFGLLALGPILNRQETVISTDSPELIAASSLGKTAS